MKKLIFGILFSLCLIPNAVFALSDTYNNHEGCSYSDIADLKEKAALVKFSYDYDTTNLMTITVSNLQDGFYIVTMFDDVLKYDASRTNPGIDVLTSYGDNQKITMTFYAASNTSCSGEELLVTYLKLPRYNPYYGNAACDGIDADKFSLCSKWYPSVVTEGEFYYRVQQYKDSLKEDTETTDDETNNNTSIMDLLLNNYQYVLIGILGITIVLIVILAIKERKRRVI